MASLAGDAPSNVGGPAPVLPAVLLLLALLGPQEEQAIVREQYAVWPGVIPGSGHRLPISEPLDLRGRVSWHLAVEGDGFISWHNNISRMLKNLRKFEAAWKYSLQVTVNFGEW